MLFFFGFEVNRPNADAQRSHQAAIVGNVKHFGAANSSLLKSWDSPTDSSSTYNAF